MGSVMSTRFLDQDGQEHSIREMSDDVRWKWHHSANRKAHGLVSFCVSCHGAAHPVHRGGLWFVAHDPGYGQSACEYADFVQASKSGMSDEHKEAAATIAIAIRSLEKWNATPERRLKDDQTGVTVVPDVYAWHNQPIQDHHRPVIHEVQLSSQGFDETRRRTDERARAEASARTIWWSPDPNTVGRLPGLIVNDTCTQVVDRAYMALEPERVPMTPTLAEAAKGLTRDRDRWALIDFEDDDGRPCTFLMPMSVGSTIQPRGGARARIRGDYWGVLDETGCERPRVATSFTSKGVAHDLGLFVASSAPLKPVEVPDDLSTTPVEYTCPRCTRPTAGSFYGPCEACRTDLCAKFAPVR